MKLLISFCNPNIRISELQAQQQIVFPISARSLTGCWSEVNFHLCCWELGSADCPSLWQQDQQVMWRVVGLIYTPEKRL